MKIVKIYSREGFWNERYSKNWLLSGLGPAKGSQEQEAVDPRGPGGVNINIGIVLRRY